MAKRKAVAHVEHSEPVSQSDSEIAATALAQRVHACSTRLEEILARIRHIPTWQREHVDFCVQRLHECEAVLLGNAEQFTRTEAVFRLRILRHWFLDSALMQPSGDEATRDLWIAFASPLRAVLVAVAKEYGRDGKSLFKDQGSEWADLESDARMRDIRAGRVPDPAVYANFFKIEREANKRSFAIWDALSQEYKAIDTELKRLANEYPESECRRAIDELREACGPRLRWAGITDSRQDAHAGGEQEVADCDEKPPTILNNTLLGILKALDGKVMRVEELAKAVTGGESSRLYRDGMKTVLVKEGYIVLDRRIGYFRPDKPPVDRISPTPKLHAKK